MPIKKIVCIKLYPINRYSLINQRSLEKNHYQLKGTPKGVTFL